MDRKRPTIYDVARAAGVSKSLVSLVLRGASGVSPSRRTAVLKAIRDLEYSPSQAAKLLAGTRSKSIGVVIDDYSNLWYVGILSGIRQVLDESGFQITLSDLHRVGDGEQDAIDGFKALHMDGAIIATEPGSLRARDYDFPAVLVGDRETDIPTIDHVTSDDFKGGYMATRHLIELGHRNIGHVTGLGGTATKRRLGYERAMAEASLATLIVGQNGTTDERAGFRGMNALMEATPSITAVFAANDYMAAGCFAFLRSRGLEMPKDISIIGHDNSPAASEFNLNLTTVAYDDRVIGMLAARLLLARIESPTRQAERVVVDPVFIPRGSTRRN
jgi:DNA-binding LacI/PurR family transcriptional regulator